MDPIERFSAMARISMPGIFSVSPVKMRSKKGTRFEEYRYDLSVPLSLNEYRNMISIDKWMHILYVYEPSPLVFEGRAVCSMYDIHQNIFCRIFASTNGDCGIKSVYVRVYEDIEYLTRDLRAEIALIRENPSETLIECVTRTQLMLWLL